MTYTTKIVQICENYKLLDRKWNVIIPLAIAIISYLLSLFCFCLISKSTFGSWMLFWGLLINFVASDMISIATGKLVASEVLTDCDIYVSDEIKYGNKISSIGFACQLLGLSVSMINL